MRVFFFSSRRRHTRFKCDWSSDVCSSDLISIFIDSANVKQIEMWLGQGIVDGATTNPSIMFKDGVADIEAGALRICKLLGDRPLSVEATSNHHETMMEPGRPFGTGARNIVNKIPIINE